MRIRQELAFLLITLTGPLYSVGCADGQSGPRRVPIWTLEEQVRIGVAFGDERYALSAISALTVGADGAVYVAQPQEGSVRVYDREGKYVRRIGREGGGPGEFVSPAAVGWSDGDLWVLDRASRRVSRFSPEGEFLNSVLVERRSSEPFTMAVPVTLLSDGSVLARVSVAAHVLAASDRQTLPLLRLGLDSTEVDTIAHLWVQNSLLHLRDPRNPRSSAISGIQPISGGGRFGVDPRGETITLIEPVREPGPRFRLTRISAGGDTLLSRTYRYRPVPLKAEHADSLVATWSDVLVQRNIISDRGRASEVARAGLYLPDELPPVTRVIVGTDGKTWIRRPGREPDVSSYTVIDSQGRIVAEVRLPANQQIAFASESTVWVEARDPDFEVPQLFRYEVHR